MIRVEPTLPNSIYRLLMALIGLACLWFSALLIPRCFTSYDTYVLNRDNIEREYSNQLVLEKIRSGELVE